MKEDTKTTCAPCEQNFERKVDELVKEGKAPTAREREEKEAEALLCVYPCYCCFL